MTTSANTLLEYRDQDFGHEPTLVRTTDNYTDEYVRGFVEKWDELIDWDQRWASEGDFFIDQLKAHGVKRVLDVATGTGFHSVRLLEAGFDVVSVDGSPYMLSRAFENARRRGHVLQTVHADWRWLNRNVYGRFDAVICLGNSFTHLFSERDRRKALAEFYAVLVHDGILVLDQRNYDSILDHGFSSKHKYYYCGEKVSAEPDYVDDGLARFEYKFSDGSVYHLNMFPLRKNYARGLMKEVGFQRIDSYGDFMETYHESDPDFFVHVAQKKYFKEGTAGVPEVEGQEFDEAAGAESDDATNAVATSATHVARDYYNSEDADRFYSEVWGGEDIHIGLYSPACQEIKQASQLTVDAMADRLGPVDESSVDENPVDANPVNENSVVLDLGSGYGGAARRLVQRFGCRVICLNLSEVENQRNRELNRASGLNDRIQVLEGSFESIPRNDASVDIIWSQDAILHSGNRPQVLQEMDRVLKPGGQVVFTDPMQANDCPLGVLDAILARIHLTDLGSPQFYLSQASKLGWIDRGYQSHAEQLTTHYTRVLETTVQAQQRLQGLISAAYLERMKAGLEHWIEGGRNGNLEWGIFHFVKPSSDQGAE